MNGQKGNVLVVVLVVLVGIFAGAALLLGIGNAVGVAVSPLVADMREVQVTQKSIMAKLSSPDQDSNLNTRLAAIEAKLSAIESKLGNGGGPGGGAPQMPQPPQEDFNKVYDIPVGDTPILGKKDAPVTIVAFSDMQCPFCARFHPAVKEVLKAYPDKVNFMLKNFPLSFHPNALPAAKLALAANLQNKYYDMVDLLLENGGSVTEDKIQEYAKKLGLNYKKLMDDYKNKDEEWGRKIKADMALGADVDVRGTPTFFLNGKKTMARDLNAYKAEIDKILGEKK